MDEVKVTPMQQRIIDQLADGRWHHSWQFVTKANMVDYRRRLTELNEKFPGRFESRFRKAHKGQGGPSKDWIDTWARDKVRKEIRGEVYRAKQDMDMNRKGTDTAAIRMTTMTLGKLAFHDIDYITDIVTAEYCDPYGVTA